MLELSRQQLEFLIIVDGQDDWHPTAFINVVVECYESSQEKPFDKAEFQSMMAQIKTLTTAKIAELQIALNILESL